MNAIKAWASAFAMVAQYFLFKLHLAKFPTLEGRYDEILYFLGQFMGFNRYIRVRNRENVPVDHPAVFYGNHAKIDDPFYMFKAAYMASEHRVKLRSMLRDDFFRGTILKTPIFDMDEFMTSLGAYGLHREKPTLAQLKVFLNILQEGNSFVMFPGRTRTRSGLLFEYRDTFQEPGGVSFFLNQMQRRSPGITVSAVPTCRNYNPVRKHTSIIFGPEQFLEPGADREAQRAFDAHLLAVLGDYVEVNAPQIVSALCYLQCLHNRGTLVGVDPLIETVAEFFDRTEHPYLDSEDEEDIPRAVVLTLEYLQREGMIARKAKNVALDSVRILYSPPLTLKYRKQNAVRYLTNQLLHLGSVTALIDDLAPSLHPVVKKDTRIAYP